MGYSELQLLRQADGQKAHRQHEYFAALELAQAESMKVERETRQQESPKAGGGAQSSLFNLERTRGDVERAVQEAAALLGKPQLLQMSDRLTAIGDDWRAFALKAARMVKGREAADPAKLAALLREQARREESFFRDLKAAA